MAKFNRILADLAKRQLQFDFKLEGTPYEGQVEIGVGAFGIVCEAIDTRTNTRVAVKKIGHAAATPTLARRTLREVRVLRYICHDNIVPLLDMFQASIFNISETFLAVLVFISLITFMYFIAKLIVWIEGVINNCTISLCSY